METFKTYRSRFTWLCAILAAFTLSSCKLTAEPEIVKKPTTLNYTVQAIDTQAIVEVKPTDYRCYYYFENRTAKEMEGVDEQKFMKECVDSLYDKYQEWLKTETDNIYKADFGSHCLRYGNSTEYYIQLEPETDYEIVGFCVNADSHEAIGGLQRYKYRTQKIDTEYVSPITIDFEVNMYLEDFEPKSLITIRPTDNAKLCLDPYTFTWIPEPLLIEYFDNSPTKFLEYIEEQSEEFPELQEDLMGLIANDVITETIDNTIGERMVLICAPFFTTWRQKVFYLRYDWEENATIPFTHELEQSN